MAATAKVIEIFGKKSKPESQEHIMIFPGGSISVCRTSDDEYWAHIEVNKKEIISEAHRSCKKGLLVNSRVDRDFPFKNDEIPNLATVNHVAIRIKTEQ